MNTDFRYFPYIIRDLVSQVRAIYDPDAENYVGTKPVFEFGTYLELTKRIQIKDQIDAAKYPLIWLVWEANESEQRWVNKVTYEVRPRLFVCIFTSTDYSSVERYDTNFVNVLFPVWELFKEYLEFNEFVSEQTGFQYSLAEHLLWGESLGFQKKENILFDTLDALEIKFENLEINKIC